MTLSSKIKTLPYLGVLNTIMYCLTLMFCQSANATLTCEMANAYVEAGLLDDALKGIKGINISKQTKKDKKCYTKLLNTIAKEKKLKDKQIIADKIKAAKLLQITGNYTEAIKLLRTTASSINSNNAIIIALKELKRQKAKAEFSYAKVLDNAGLHDEALSVFKTTIKNNPDSAIPPNLAHLSGGGIMIWRDIKLWLKKYALPVAEILLSAFLVFLILHFLWRWKIAKPLLVIGSFDDTGMQQKPGKAVTALMQAAYQDFTRSHRTAVTRISGNLEAVALPTAIQQALPLPLQQSMIQAVVALFDKIFPRRSYSVEAYLQNSETKGAGLSIRIVTSKQQLGSATLWTSDFRGPDASIVNKDPSTNIDQSGDFEHLAEYAAIWLLFKLTNEPTRYSILTRWWHRRQLSKRLGTSSWLAYALFRAGYHLCQVNANDEAKELYVAALRIDPALSIAKINLAHLAKKDEINRPFAQSLLQECCEEGDKRRFYFSYPHEQSHYAALYSLASLTFDNKEYQLAHNLAQKLMTSIEKRSNQLVHLSLWGVLKIRTDLKDYLDYLSTYVNAMLGGLKIKIGDIDDGIKIITEMTDSRIGYGLPRLHYNLACSYSIWAAIETGDTQQYLLDHSLEALRTSFWLSEDIASRARENDLSLEFVSHNREEEFKKIIALKPSLPQQTTHYDLENLLSISKSHANKLSQEKIESVSDFLFATKTPTQREHLADVLGLGTEQITEWALAMELASIRGIELEDVNSLNKANVRSLEELQLSDPIKLRLSLIDWAKTTKTKTVPSESVVQLWVSEALMTSPFIQV